MSATAILGAGPTGLGAAYRLVERGETDFEVFERAPRVGGLATSFTDPKGFTWDVSGHIIFSGYPYFNAFLEKMLGKDGLRRIDRESWIKFEDRYVRYPFQNHLSSLPEEAMLECLIGLVESQTIDRNRAFTNFEEWVFAKFGAGVAKHFMVPYNLKVWSTPLDRMGFYWIAERVAVVDWKKALETTLRPKVTDWGPNATFGYPATKGTLGLWLAVLPYLGDRVLLKKRMTCVDEDKREITFADGSTRRYDRLLTTLPLDAFVPRLAHAPEPVRAAARKLMFNRLFTLGIGLRRPSPSNKNWIYFPNLKLERSDLDLVESKYLIHAAHAYPIPSVDRNEALDVIQPYLESKEIFSRGRFGSWKYEIGNQDHSLMQGVELVDRWLDGSEEKVFRS